MAEHNKTGRKGELLALEFLRTKGYEILDTNWQDKKVEIDIIARFKGQLVIVEVKTRSSTVFEVPKEAVTISKQRNIIKATNAYIEMNSIDLECRFDIVAIVISNNNSTIEHIEEAFYPLL